MGFRSFFENKKAVSPVIGVVLMVAITVILSAAIGASVFGQSIPDSPIQVKIDIKAVNDSYVKIEHLGGDLVDFTDNSTTKVFVANDTESVELDFMSLGLFDVGHMNLVELKNASNGNKISFSAGDQVKFKVVDVARRQLLIDKMVRF